MIKRQLLGSLAIVSLVLIVGCVCEPCDEGKKNKELVAEVSYYLVCTEDRADDQSVRLLRHWIVQNFAEAR